MADREAVWNGGIYVVRDVWSDGGHEYSRGLRLVRCEYGVLEGDNTVWKPCVEGVIFADIEPHHRLPSEELMDVFWSIAPEPTHG